MPDVDPLDPNAGDAAFEARRQAALASIAAPPPAPAAAPTIAAPPPAPALHPTDARDVAKLRRDFHAALNPNTPPAVRARDDEGEGAILKGIDERAKAADENARRRAYYEPPTYEEVRAKQAEASQKEQADAAAWRGAPPAGPPAPFSGLTGSLTVFNPRTAYGQMQQGPAQDQPLPVAAPPRPAPAAPVNPASLTFAQPPAPTAPTGPALPPPPAASTTVVPAHTMPIVAPQMQAQEQALDARQQQQALQQGEQRTQAGLQAARAQGEVVSEDQSRARALQASVQGQRAELSPYEKDQVDAWKQQAKMHLSNPDTRGWGARIADSIGAALSAAGNGFLHQNGPNPVLDRIHQDIDREVDRQKDEYTRVGDKAAHAGNVWAQVYKRTGDARQADDLAHQVYSQAAGEHAKQVADQGKTAQDRQAGEVAALAIERSGLERKKQENPYVQAQTVASGSLTAAEQAQAYKFQSENGDTPEVALQRVLRSRYTNQDRSAPIAAPTKIATAGAGAPTINPGEVIRPKSASGLDNPINAISRQFQGTDARHAVDQQGAYNSDVMSFGKTNLGLRIPQDAKPWDIPALAPYVVAPGDSRATIKEKRELFLSAVARHPKPAGKGGGGAGEGEEQ